MKQLLAELVQWNVYDVSFSNTIQKLVKNSAFSSVLFGGRLYNFDYFSEKIERRFETGVTLFDNYGGSDYLYASIAIQYFHTLRDSKLFGLDFTSETMRYPSIIPQNKDDIVSFIYDIVGFPAAFLISQGDKFESAGPPVFASVDICDGDARLLIGSQ